MDSNTKKISIANSSSGSSLEKNNNQTEQLCKLAKSKIQSLLMEADSRLRIAERHNIEARDLLGQISHLIDGTEVKDFCKPNCGQTPVDVFWANKRCAA